MEQTLPLEQLSYLLTQLISFPTVTGQQAHIDNCLNWVRHFVEEHNPSLHLQQFESHHSPSLLMFAGDSFPRVLLCGHLDVVESTSDHAFTAVFDHDNHVQGRGAADMKGPIAALLDIMVTQPPPGLGLLLSTDEESGGFDGVHHVLQQIDWQPEVVILPDGGADFRLVYEQKGFYILHIWIEMAYAGPTLNPKSNPVDRLARAILQLGKNYPNPVSEEDWKVSLTPSQIHGKFQSNGQPTRADATLDVRYPHTETGDGAQLVDAIAQRLRRYYGISLEAQVAAPPYFLDPQSPYIAAVQRAAQHLHIGPLPLTREAGSSDARHFAEKNIPVLIFQPTCADWHGQNEWVSLDSLLLFRNLTAGAIREILR
jgi:succinyl-diaminopimelate desuccinylase